MRLFRLSVLALTLGAFVACFPAPDSQEDSNLEGVSTVPTGGPGGNNTTPGGNPGGGNDSPNNTACLDSATRRVSVYTGNGSVAINQASYEPSTDSRGTLVAFTSLANLALNQDDTNEVADVYLHNVTTCTTRRISVHPRGDGAVGGEGSSEPSIAANGGAIAFTTTGNFEPDLSDNNGFSDVYLHVPGTGETRRVSVYTGSGSTESSGDSYEPAVSADGNVIAFTSAANLEPDQSDNNGDLDVYIHNVATNQTRRVSIYTGTGSTETGGDSYQPSISADGNIVAFTSRANLEPDQSDNNGDLDVYIHNVATNQTRRVSIYTGTGSTETDGDSFEPAIAAAGNVVAFTSRANLALDQDDNNGDADVYIHNLSDNQTRRVSKFTGSGSVETDGDSTQPSISAEGDVIAFTSLANLDPDSERQQRRRRHLHAQRGRERNRAGLDLHR